jgi:FkbM family methyltransferase
VSVVKQIVRRGLRGLGYEIVRRRDVHSLKEHLFYVLGGEDVDCVVDVGALRGDYAAFIRSVGYAGPIASFEPVEESFRELAANAASDPGWTVHRLALGSRDETREIGVAGSADFSSFRGRTSFAADAFAAETELAGRELVEVRRLDSILADVAPQARRVFLKLDTQGWDLEVLAGAAGCLDRIVALQLEIAARPLYEGTPTYLESLEYATRLGFELTDAVPIVRDLAHHVIEYDCVLVRNGSG